MSGQSSSIVVVILASARRRTGRHTGASSSSTSADDHKVCRGAGMTDVGPMTLFQIAWLNVCAWYGCRGPRHADGVPPPPGDAVRDLKLM
jgi:hypothetical protein